MKDVSLSLSGPLPAVPAYHHHAHLTTASARPQMISIASKSQSFVSLTHSTLNRIAAAGAATRQKLQEVHRDVRQG